MNTVKNIEEFESLLNEELAVLAYYSHEKCSVCKTLKPKFTSYFSENYPKLKLVYIDIETNPEIAAGQSVFTAPVVIVYFDGKESFRKVRAFGINEIAELIDRPYGFL